MKPFGFRKTFRFNKMQGRIRELRNDEDVGDCIRLCKTIHSFKSIEQDIEKIPPLHPPMPEKGTRFNELPMMESTCHELFNLAEKRHRVLSVIKRKHFADSKICVKSKDGSGGIPAYQWSILLEKTFMKLFHGFRPTDHGLIVMTEMFMDIIDFPRRNLEAPVP